MTTLVLMVIHGTDGDVLPFVRIGRALRDRGHDVTLFSHEYYRPAVRAAGLDFVPVDTIDQYEHYLLDAAGQIGATDIGGFRDHFDRTGLADQLRFESDELIRRYRPGRTVLVGAPVSAQSVLIAAEATGAPLVCLAHAPFHLAALPRIAWLYHEVLADRVDAVRAGVGLGPVGDWTAWMSSARSYVGLWPAWFDNAGPPSPPGTVLAGFVLGDERDGAPPPPPPPPPPVPGAVLVTGGTGRLLPPEFYRIAVEALAVLGRPGLLVVRHRDLVPDPLPANVHWFPRLPFRTVVPRVAAVVHHGGIGTVARAVASGVPQVVLASGLDRPDNAQRLARCGLAGWLPQECWSVEQLVDCVRTALANGVRGPVSTGPDSDGAAGPDSSDGAAGRAADAVEAALTR